MAQDSNRLTLQPLGKDQYRQVAEWEWGPQEDVDWERYAAEMNAPQWAHFGLYDGAELIGCVSLEKIDRQMVAGHVVTARRKIHPLLMAQVLLKTAGDLFALGYTAMVARIPKDKRAAARLALRCGMREWGHTPETRYFILTKSRWQLYGPVEARTCKSSVSTATAAN